MRGISLMWFIPLLFFFGSCSESHEFEKSRKWSEPWSYGDTLMFEFDLSDTTKFYLLGMELIWNIEEYPYQNCYFRMITGHPDGHQQSDLVNLDFLNKQGVSLGKCRGNSCKTNYVLQSGIHFNQEGKYRIAITQETRQDFLPGIEKSAIYLDVQE